MHVMARQLLFCDVAKSELRTDQSGCEPEAEALDVGGECCPTAGSSYLLRILLDFRDLACFDRGRSSKN